jgi:LPS-assembly protein
MFRRNRLSITAALACHLVLTSCLVTSQLLPAQPAGGSARPSEPVTIKAQEQEKSGDIYKLRGNAEVDFRKFVLRADEATYDASTDEVTASGHLTLDGGPHDEHIVASHGQYNVRSETGKFYDVIGTSGVRFHGSNVVLTSSNPFTFTGKIVEKTAPEVYVVHHGTVTSCKLPRPKWTLNGERIVVDLGGKAQATNSTFRLERVPLFYLPYADHPADQLGRQSGFLMPAIGTSSSKGTILGEGFYWAIDRSMDATVGAEYFSDRGWSQHGSWRFRPGEDSYINARYFGVIDRENQGGEDFNVDGQAQFPYGFRGVLSAEYLSSYLFRLAWGQTFAQAVDSEVKSVAFLSKNLNGFGFNFMAARYQNFESQTQGDVITIFHVPSFEVSSVDRRIGSTPVYWSFDTALQGVSRSEPNPQTGELGFQTNDLVGRFDVNPRASLPLLLGGWTLRPEIGLRETYYTERQLPPNINGGLPTPVQQYINRNAAEASFELRPPALVRIFERPVFGHKLKHAIEPRLVYRFVGGVDNFANIIRFDYRDILSNTNELEYAVIQRLYVKPAGTRHCEEPAPTTASPGAGTRSPAFSESTSRPCETRGARELVSWELKQKYFFDPYFGGALVNGVRNVFTTTDEFTGIAFLTSPRLFTPIVSRILVHPSSQTEFGWQLDYDPVPNRISPTTTLPTGINASTVFANYRFGNFFLGGTQTYFRDFASNPIVLDRFNQFRVTLGYGNLAKHGINAATNIGFDANLRFLQYSAFQTSYNWDCCGLSFEYRRYALGAVRNENQFRFAFTLANIATFGNLKRQERIY